jgi:predicted NUDIX family NTP pyrophosphohydrolase
MSQSAGILLYRRVDEVLRVLLVHPGGPYWRNKNSQAWSIPKGEFDETESAEAAARREFEEELGVAPEGALLSLGTVTQAGGKRVYAFALEGCFDPATLRSARFTIEWPPRSGKVASFPEVDRAEWFSLTEAREKIVKAQAAFLGRLEHHTSSGCN